MHSQYNIVKNFKIKYNQYRIFKLLEVIIRGLRQKGEK
jgi:hypothetical protein